MGTQKRDFIYVSDVVSAYSKVLNHVDELGQYSEFDVGTGEKTTIKDFVMKFCEIFCSIHPECTSQLNFGAIPYRDGELMDVSVDNSHLIALGWTPQVDLDEGIRKIILTDDGQN